MKPKKDNATFFLQFRPKNFPKLRHRAWVTKVPARQSSSTTHIVDKIWFTILFSYPRLLFPLSSCGFVCVIRNLIDAFIFFRTSSFQNKLVHKIGLHMQWRAHSNWKCRVVWFLVCGKLLREIFILLPRSLFSILRIVLTFIIL